MKLNLSAGINKTGYGIVATNILKHLVKNKHEVVLFPIGGTDVDSQSLAGVVQDAYNNQENYSGDDPGLKIWHQFALADKYSTNNANAGLTFFELDRLTKKEAAHINSLDLLFVGSQWAKNIVDSQCSPNWGKAVVLPMGVDTDVFYPKPVDNSRAYRFFSTGKQEKRKGHDIIIELFNSAFEPDDDVELHLKITNPFLPVEDYNQYIYAAKSSKLANKIFFHDTKTQNDLANIIQSCDCGLFPTRTEGFGLGILEGIACSKPIISTNYSAVPDFCTGHNAFLVNPDGMEDAYDGKWFFNTGQWASFQQNAKDSFISHMRYCYSERIQVKNDYQSILDIYNWDNTVHKIVENLE